MQLKTSALIFGIPVTWLMITTVGVSFMSYFLGHGWFFIITAIGVLMFLAPTYLKRKLVLPVTAFPLTPHVAISGMKETFFPALDHLIKANKKIKVGLPLDRALRAGIEQYVTDRGGLIDIIDSGEPVVGAEPLPETTFILIQKTKSDLNSRVDEMTQRGWKVVSKPSTRYYLVARRFSQTLHYTAT